MQELTPTGRLRVGVAFAPSASPLFVVKDADGKPRGVTVDLADELAKELGVAVDLIVAPNTGELVDGLEAGMIDVSFMPVDDERKNALSSARSISLSKARTWSRKNPAYGRSKRWIARMFAWSASPTPRPFAPPRAP